MSLPAFNEDGNLPSGVFPSTLMEVRGRFGDPNVERILLMQRLDRIYEIARQTGFLRRFVVFGSFVTHKPRPRDVDIFMVMENGFNVKALTGEAQIAFDHPAADAYF